MVSLIVDDIFGEYSWEGLSETSGSFKENLPAVSSLGASYKINDSIKVLSKIDYVNPDGLNLFRLSSGLELDRDLYTLRVGAVQSNGLSNESFKAKLLLGAGVNVAVVRERVVRLDYCIDFGQENEGISNLFSLSFIK